MTGLKIGSWYLPKLLDIDDTNIVIKSNALKSREFSFVTLTLQWRHNYHDSVSNHQPHGCLLNRLFRRRSKKTSKLRVTGLCVGNSPGPVNSSHKWPVTRKMFPFDDVIMKTMCDRYKLVRVRLASMGNKVQSTEVNLKAIPMRIKIKSCIYNMQHIYII